MEVAARLRGRGLAVTIVSQEKLPFAEHLGAPVGEALMQLHKRRDVSFRLESQAAAIEGDTQVRSVLLKSGERLPANLIVAGFGVAPAILPG